MNTKKIIFFDIDGTIWDWEEVIPDSTKEAIKELAANGHIPVICSGRARAHLINYDLFKMGFKDMVASCGNHVEVDGNLVFERLIPVDTVSKIINLAELNRVPIVLEGTDYHWVSKKGFEKDNFVDRMYKNMGERAIKGLSISDGMKVNKVSGDRLNCSIYENFKSELVDEFDFIEHGLAPNIDQNPGTEDNEIAGVFELVPKGTSKAMGIRKYCEYRNVDPKDTIAVGDSANDIEMLRAVGFSIAMGNGTDDIKKISDYVTDDIHKDGVYNAMKHLKLI